MRLLHTSDWHLGRTFHGVDLIDAQRNFVAHLVEVARAEDVDAVLVSGDVYDRAIPSLEAVEILEQGLAELALHAQVIISSGNHDSARRLGFASDLLEGANVHLRTRLADITRPVVLDDGGTRVHVYAIPFLEPYTTASHLGIDEHGHVKRTHESVLAAAVQRIAEHRAQAGAGKTVLMSHAWFNGGEASESEIDISMGGIGRASTALLQSFDYAALGHLHKPQAIEDHQRYSGSPLHYSFSEMGTAKQTFIVDLAGNRAQVTPIDVPVFRELHELRDTMQALMESPEYARYETSFLRIHLEDLPVPEQAANVLRRRFPYLVDLKVRWSDSGPGITAGQMATLSPLEICNLFLESDRGARASEREQAQLEQAIASGRRGLVDAATTDNVACTHEDVHEVAAEDAR